MHCRVKTCGVTERARARTIQTSKNDGVHPLPGYTRCEFAGGQLVAMDAVIGAASEVLSRSGTLYSWARSVQQPRALHGRAPVFVATLSGPPDTTVVVRHAWHGGLLAPFTRDMYRRPSRAPAELQISQSLREVGIPTPELVAYALYAVAPGLVRVDVASRYIPDSYDFAAVLADHAPSISRADAFRAIQFLLLQLARHGFVHPDLNVKNILLYREAHVVTAAVLDVDVMQRVPVGDARKARIRNFERFDRSLRKAPAQFGVHLSDAEFESFRAMMKPAREDIP